MNEPTYDWPVMAEILGKNLCNLHEKLGDMRALLNLLQEQTNYCRALSLGAWLGWLQEKKGNFFPLGCSVEELKAQDKILLAEGFSTAASLHQASGLPTVIAGDIYNMEAVAGEIRKIAPEAEIYICADNDHAHKLPNGQIYNIGTERAKEVAAKHKAQVIVPQLTKEEKDKGLKDFNDIHSSRGLTEVKKQIETGLEHSKAKELAR